MTAISKPRPRAVTALGVFYVFGAIVSLVCGLLIVAGSIVMFRVGEPPPPLPAEVPPMAQRFVAALPYLWMAGMAQIALAGLTLGAALAFLRLRRWGRAALEAVTWFSLVVYLAYVAWWTSDWVGMTRWVTQHGHNDSDVPPQAFGAFGLGLGATAVVFGLLIIAGALLRPLRSRGVREAMER